MNRKLRRCTVVAACIFTIMLLANPGLAFAQEDEDAAEQLEEWQQQELRPLLDRLTAAIKGEVPAEKVFEISPDFLKGSEGSIYVPFKMKIDPLTLTQSQFILYMFVTPHVEPAAADADAPENQEDAFQNTTYEDLFFVDVSDVTTTVDGMLELHRAFQAQSGTYDVYLVARDSVGEDGDFDDLDDSMVMLHKEEVEVPNFWNEELQTSSIIMAQSLDLIDAPLVLEDQRINPYTIGTTQITPKPNANYTTSEDFSLLFYVYNPQLTAEMNPDVTVEFDFYRVGPAGESFFNKTTPQAFDATTWPAGVPVTGGLPSGQSVPLASFPAGDFRLEIKITDNAAEQTLIRDVHFNVAE